MSRHVLVLGASGHSGSALVRAFTEDNWQVRRFRRGEDPARAAKGVDLIVNAMNPPNYHDWANQIPQITALAMEAARASGARVLIPGNVYVYGTQPAPWSPDTAPKPCSRKGRIRVEMEAAWRASGLPVTILRAGDFIDGSCPELMMGRVVLKSIAKGKITALGPSEVTRAYAYLPDYARAAVALARRDDLPTFADIPFPGHSFSLNDLALEVARQTDYPVRMSQFPWWTLRLASPLWELARELTEMRYLYRHPYSLDGRMLSALLHEFATTPFAEVVAGHLR